MKRLLLGIALSVLINSSAIAHEEFTWIDGVESLEVEIVEWYGLGDPPVSPTNTARVYYSATLDTLRVSENGGAYQNILQDAVNVDTDTTNFNDILSPADDTIQKVADTMDDGAVNVVGDTTGTATEDFNFNLDSLVISYDDKFVGIGTASPAKLLDVAGQLQIGTGSSLDSKLFFKDATANEWELGIVDTATDFFFIWDTTNSAYRLVLDAVGNIGIGTITPAAELHITAATPELRMESSGDSNYTHITRTDTGGVAQRFNIANQPSSGDVANSVWKSGDGDTAGVKSINTYSDPDSKTIIEGKTHRYNIAGVEVGQTDVNGTRIFDSGSAMVPQVIIRGAVGASENIVEVQNSSETELFAVDENGTTIHYDNDITQVDDISTKTISSAIGLSDNNTVKLILGSAVGDDFKVGNNNTLVVEGDDDQVGIGELNPQDKLEVNGTVLIKDKLKFTQDDGNEYIDSLVSGELDLEATSQINLRINTAEKWLISDVVIRGTESGSGVLANEIASATNPVLTKQGDKNTGIGFAAGDQLSLIAGAVEGIRITEATSVATIDLFGDTTIATDKKHLFRDSAIGIYSQADTFMDLFADGGVRIGNSSAGAPTTLITFEPDGDTFWTGSGSGLPFGSFWGNELGFVSAGGTGTFFEIVDASAPAITVGQTNLTTFQNSKELAVTKAGMYSVSWSISVKGTGAGKHIVGGIGVDAGGAGALTIQNDGRNHAVTLGSSEMPLSGHAILDLSASSEVGLMATNETDNSNVTIEHVTLILTQIGGT